MPVNLLAPNEEVQLAIQTFQNDQVAWAREYDLYEQGYRFLAGKHYTDEQISWYELQRRPTYVWNLVFPIFNSMLGNFLLSQSKDRVYATTTQRPNTAEIFEDLLDNIMIQGGGKDEFSKAMFSGLIKRGWLYPRFSDERELEGSINLSAEDEFDFTFDPRARRYDLMDAVYMTRSRWLTTDRITALWPNHRRELEESLRDVHDSKFLEAAADWLRNQAHHKDWVDYKSGQYRVLEFHYRTIKPTEVVADTVTGNMEILRLSGKKRDLFLRANPTYRIVERTAPLIDVLTVVPAINFRLEKKEAEIQDGYFDYFPFSAYNYGMNTIENFGIIQNAVGPNKDFNDRRNRSLDIMNKIANAGTLAKPDQILNWGTVKQRSNEPGLIKEVEKNARLDDVWRREEAPSYPAGEGQLAQEEFQLLHRITGVTENYVGQTQSQQENASLFAYRVRQAEKSMFIIERNIRNWRRNVMNRVIKLIQKYYDTERVLLIHPPGKDPRTIALNLQLGDQVVNDVTQGDYRILVSSEEQNPTAKYSRWLQKWEIAQILLNDPQLGADAMDWEWLFQEADLGEVDMLIQKIMNKLNQTRTMVGNAQAMADAQNLMTAARQKVDMEEGGLAGPAGPAGRELPAPLEDGVLEQ